MDFCLFHWLYADHEFKILMFTFLAEDSTKILQKFTVIIFFYVDLYCYSRPLAWQSVLGRVETINSSSYAEHELLIFFATLLESCYEFRVDFLG